MTLTVRSASVTGAVTAGRVLTHAEMDANIAQLASISGSFVRSTEYSTAAELDAAQALLVQTLGAYLWLVSGVRFPATAVPSSDANTLDDYEEGTFTPTITGNSGHAPAAYFTQKGRYTKIGNRVDFALEVQINGIGTLVNSEALSIAGLPFAAGSGASYPAHVACWLTIRTSAITATTPWGTISAGQSVIDLRKSMVVIASSSLLKDDIAVNQTLLCNGTYWV